MSMYDELVCAYPLPDGWIPGEAVFLTQDTPAQWLHRYRLEADGTLHDETTGEAVPFHGALTFSTGNVCCTGPCGFTTDDDAPPWWAEYTAVYDHGTLLKLEGAKRPHTDVRGPHLTRAEWQAQHRVWGEQREAARAEEAR